MGSSFDVAVIGGGSAGCVAAARLSEDPARRVIVIEAGRTLARSRTSSRTRLARPS
jgi:choline dehydrogenase-like flavoprotein